MKVEAIFKDCRIDKAVVVSKLGFTPDAIEYAKASNVQLVELNEYNFFRKDNIITKIYVHLEITQSALLGIRFELR